MKKLVLIFFGLIFLGNLFGAEKITAEKVCDLMVEWKTLGDSSSGFQTTYGAGFFKSQEEVAEKCEKLIRKNIFNNSVADFQPEALELCISRPSISLVFECLQNIKNHTYTKPALEFCYNTDFWDYTNKCLKILANADVEEATITDCKNYNYEYSLKCIKNNSSL